MKPHLETIIEIAWEDEYLFANDFYDEDVDSMSRKEEIISIADQFEIDYAGVDWNAAMDAGEAGYYEVVETYAKRKLLQRFGKGNYSNDFRWRVNFFSISEPPISSD